MRICRLCSNLLISKTSTQMVLNIYRSWKYPLSYQDMYVVCTLYYHQYVLCSHKECTNGTYFEHELQILRRSFQPFSVISCQLSVHCSTVKISWDYICIDEHNKHEMDEGNEPSIDLIRDSAARHDNHFGNAAFQFAWLSVGMIGIPYGILNNTMYLAVKRRLNRS